MLSDSRVSPSNGVFAALLATMCGCNPHQYRLEPPDYYVNTLYEGPELVGSFSECPAVAVPFGLGHDSINTGLPYNHPSSGNLHNGIDFPGEIGTTVIAPAAGAVVATFRPPVGSGGRIVAVDAGVDDWGNHIFYLVGHLHRFSVSAGQRVNRGDKLGEVGKSGGQRVSHLHFSGFTTETGVVRQRLFGHLYLGDHDLLDPAALALGGADLLPFDPLHTYGDAEGSFQGFTHPLCTRSAVHSLVE
jgi:hypothetical protein